MPETVDAALFRPDLVASDLDGTLLPATAEELPRTRRAIDRLRVAGIPFVICTGRMFCSARRVAASLGLRAGPAICYQGAMVADLATGERLLHRPMSAAAAAEVVRHVRELGRHLNAYIDDTLYVEELDDWARFYAAHTEVGIEQVADLEAEVTARPPTKLVLISDAADVERLLPDLLERWRGRLYVTRSQPEYIEIAAPTVTKSGALQWLCDRQGWRRDHAVTCGDGHNDIDMLRWAGLGVAMAEAAPEVRAASDLVVAHEDLPGLLMRLSEAQSV
jgi:Cof subfamily protein (haloacid dehalogenase superfamily)